MREIIENSKITKHRIHEPTAGEIIDVLKANGSESSETLSTEYMCSYVSFTSCVGTIQSYSSLLYDWEMPRLFDLPKDGFYKRDILNIVSAALEKNPEWKSYSLNEAILNALTDYYHSKG